MASTYHTWTNAYPSPRTKYLSKLLTLIPKDTPILELGCGSGIPCTKMLSEHSSNVTANDISAAMIELAKENVKGKGVKFVHGDMMGLEFGEGTLGAVAAFYSVIHLPRGEQEVMLRRICGWLGERGYLLLNLGTREMVGNVNENCECSWGFFPDLGGDCDALRSGECAVWRRPLSCVSNFLKK